MGTAQYSHVSLAFSGPSTTGAFLLSDRLPYLLPLPLSQIISSFLIHYANQFTGFLSYTFSLSLQTSTCMIFLVSSATIFAICKLLNLSFYSLLTSENSSKVITLFTLFLILTTLVLMLFFPVGWKKNT